MVMTLRMCVSNGDDGRGRALASSIIAPCFGLSDGMDIRKSLRATTDDSRRCHEKQSVFVALLRRATQPRPHATLSAILKTVENPSRRNQTQQFDTECFRKRGFLVTDNILGGGAFGIVMDGVHVDTGAPVAIKLYVSQREIDMSTEAASRGIGPRIYATVPCVIAGKTVIALVMEKYDRSLFSYVLNYRDTNSIQSIVDAYRTLPKSVLQQLVALLERQYNAHFVHGDMNVTNILVKFDPVTLDIESMILSDFSHSRVVMKGRRVFIHDWQGLGAIVPTSFDTDMFQAMFRRTIGYRWDDTGGLWLDAKTQRWTRTWPEEFRTPQT